MNKLEVIEKVDLLASLPVSAKALLAGEARERIVTAGEVLCREGEHGRTFWVVANGMLSVQKGEPPVEVARHAAGSYFGEMSLLTGEPRVATITAIMRSELLEFDRPAFLRLFSQNASLAPALSEQIALRKAGLARVVASAPAQRPPVEVEEDAGNIFGRIKRLFGLG